MEKPDRILIIRPSALGDVCRSVPVLVSLRAWAPDARIDWMVRDAFADALRAHPALDNVVPFPRKRFGRLWKPSVARDFLAWVRDLRKRRYDLVIDCQGLARSGLFAWLSGARVRLGFRDAREFGWVWLNRRVRVPDGEHAVERMLALLRSMDIPLVRDARLYTPDEATSPVDAHTRDAGYVVIAPGAIWRAKRWPDARFAELTELLVREYPALSVVLAGSPAEREMCPDVVALATRHDQVIDLIGQTTIGELMRVIEGAALVVANDSAAQHIAVGLERPLVVLMGPTGAQHGPYQRPDDVVRGAGEAPSFRHKRARADDGVMRAISVDDVMAAVRDRLPGMNQPDERTAAPSERTSHAAGDGA